MHVRRVRSRAPLRRRFPAGRREYGQRVPGSLDLGIRTDRSMRDPASTRPSIDFTHDTMSLDLPSGVQINAPILPGFDTILTRPALEFVAKLHRTFEPRRQE